MRIGSFLACEGQTPAALIEQAWLAEEAGSIAMTYSPRLRR